MKEKITGIINDLNTLKSQRSYLNPEWEELAQIFTPGTQSFVSNRTKPWRKQHSSIDGHAPYFAQRLTAYLFGQATNPATKFVKFFCTDPKVVLTHTEEESLDQLNHRVLRTFANSKSNFAAAIQEVFHSGIIFGPGILYLENKLGSDVRFKSIPLSQVYFSENDSNQVDSLYRVFNFTAKQIVQAFGLEAVSKEVKQAYEKEPEKEFEILHCTKPNKDSKKKSDKFISYYIELGTNNILEEKYLSSFNFVVYRWAKHIGEKYGHGQGKLALTAVRYLSHIRRENALSLAFANNPVKLIADDGVIIPDTINPGAIIIGASSSLDGQKRIDMWTPTGNPQSGLSLYESEKDLLGKIFFSEEVSMPIDKTRRTAFEVQQLENDRLRFLTLHIARIINELLKPMAELVLQLLVENGELSDLKDILDHDLEADFLGPVAQLLKMEDVRATQAFLQTVLPLAQMNPTMINRIDFDQIVKDAQKGTGSPNHILRSDEDTDKITQSQQQSQQQQVSMQNALGASEVSANLGQANKYNNG